jgi:arsenate reductase
VKSELVLYHNPRCSKSRAALALLRERGVEPHIIEYLVAPPSKDELAKLVGKLGMKPEELVRKGEGIFKSEFRGKPLSDDEWLSALAEHPILIERPIAVKGPNAVVGRPPEKVLDLL